MDKKNRAKLTRKIIKKDWITDFIHHSNGIEGIVTSKASILSALCTENAHVHPYIKNHIDSIMWIFNNFHKVPTNESICALHRMLLFNVDRFAGRFRNIPVRVGDHLPPSSEKVPSHLRIWFQLWGKKPYKSWSHKKAALFRHYEFEWIHPFTDGNGRVGRLLMFWDCLHHNTKMDIIESTPEKRTDYYKQLRDYGKNKRNALLERQWV